MAFENMDIIRKTFLLINNNACKSLTAAFIFDGFYYGKERNRKPINRFLCLNIHHPELSKY